jgi:flagellar M-ring protein FliF
MNEWFKKLLDQLKTLWSKWTMLQKIILFGTIGVVIIAIVLLVAFSSAPSMVPLFGAPIKDEELRTRITTKLDEEIPGKYQIRSDNLIMVSNQKDAKRMRALLAREDLIPKEADPWQIFDIERWTLTDFERKINVRRAITKTIEQHITALDEIDSAHVVIDMPEDSFFSEDQKPYTASIQITPKPGANITEDRKKIQGIEKLVILAISGLKHENIVITDNKGNVLNDFEGLEKLDNLNLVKRQLALKQEKERETKGEILKELQGIYKADRVKLIKLEIDLDLSEEKSKIKEFTPIVVKKDNPRTPFDETQTQDSIVVSEQSDDEKFEGTGINPEGPPGQEGQSPPQYKDLTNLNGKYSRTSAKKNYNVNETNKERVERPWQIKRLSVGIALDGWWETQYDKNGNVQFEENNKTVVKRTYHPVPDEELAKVAAVVKDAVGYSRDRGDSVTVEHLQFDRKDQFLREDEKYRQAKAWAEGIFWVLIGISAIILAALFIRLISKYVEKKRREKEEELARQHQAMREAALKSAEDQGMDVELSVEDRARMEMQENAINMAREHPEDVAQLIRTWLVEE